MAENPKPYRESMARVESEKDALLMENIALKQQSEALSNAAQAIGLTLQGRLRDIEARHEAEMLKGNIAQGSEMTRDKKKKRKDESRDKYRDAALFLAGAVTAAVTLTIISFLFKRS